MKFINYLLTLSLLPLLACSVSQQNTPVMPSISAIRAAYLASNPYGLVPSLTFSSFTLPLCTTQAVVDIDRYLYISNTAVNDFLDFNHNSNVISPATGSSAEIPDLSNERHVINYQCETILGSFASTSFYLNDLDEDTLTDATEYNYRFIPLLNNMGSIKLNYNNVSLYRGSRTTFKVPSGIGSTPLSLNTADAATDSDGDGINNTIEITNGTNLFVAESDGTFATGVDSAVGSSPFGITIGDVTNDGNVDLLVANFGGSSVSLVSGNGDGTFNPKLDFTTGDGPVGVNIADFDSDGEMDFVVANSVDDNVSVFLAAGSGKVDYSTGDTPYHIAVGDIDNDGDIDLAVTNFGNSITGNSISVLLNDGDGTFATKVDYTTGNGPYFIVAADFNEDENLDIAVTNFNNGNGTTLSVLIGNGDGTFDAKVDYTTVSGPAGLVTGDFDDDGHLDLAVANDGHDDGTSLSIFIGNGDGTFDAKVDYTTLGGPFGLLTFDKDGDGDLDLAVSHAGGSIVPYTNDGSGVFTADTGFAANSGVGYTFYISAGDIDSDGDIDLLSSNFSEDAVSLFLNQ